MAKKGFGCERQECSASTSIADQATFGTGLLDEFGFWEFPCEKCEDAWHDLLFKHDKQQRNLARELAKDLYNAE